MLFVRLEASGTDSHALARGLRFCCCDELVAGVQRAVARWHPYAGLVYFHLLLDRLAARGDLE
jgi:hypothetical protein